MKVAYCLLVVGLWVMALPAVAETKPINKIEARAISPAATKQIVLAQFGDLLIEEPRLKTRHPVRPLSDLWYRTPIRSTYAPGLCATDTITFRFLPTTDRKLGAKTPVRVSAVESKTTYRFIEPPSVVEGEERPSRLKDHAACAKLRVGQTLFFSATDEGDAISGWVVLERVLKSGRTMVEPLPFELVCDRRFAPECRSALASFALDHLSDLSRCAPKQTGDFCWDYGFYDRKVGGWLALRAEGSYQGSQVRSVTISDVVVTADSRID